MEIKRYQNIYRHQPRSVAEHSWMVGMIAHQLARKENALGNKVNFQDLLERCLYHDTIEIYSGDILSSTKKVSVRMKNAIKDMEEKLFAFNIAQELSEEETSYYYKLMLEAKDETIEGRLLEAADILDTLFEALEEIRLSNHRFTFVYQKSLEALKKSELPSVALYLDELQKEGILLHD